MNAEYIAFKSQRRFGVEVEVNRFVAQSSLVDIINTVLAGDQRASQRPWCFSCDNKDWEIKTDASCGDTGNRNDGGGFEIASSVGKGVKHLTRVEKVVDALQKNYVKVNRYCGLHCQVEIKDFSIKQAATLLAYWCKIEPWLPHLAPSFRDGSMHCVPHIKTTGFGTFKKLKNVEHEDRANVFWKHMKLKGLGAKDKRNTITLVNFQRTRSQSGQWISFNRPTVELRYPESSLESFDAKNWSRMFLHFVDSCAEREFPNNLKAATFEELLEILGLKSSKASTILSPGLYETLCWLLYRMDKWGKPKVRGFAKRYYNYISTPYGKWKFKFPQVIECQKPINHDCGRVSHDCERAMFA